MQALAERNDNGSWYFIEKLSIDPVSFNVTISLSSGIMAAADTFLQAGEIYQDDLGDNGAGAGLLAHIVRTSGFQLINVHNVPIQMSVRAPLPPPAA